MGGALNQAQQSSWSLICAEYSMVEYNSPVNIAKNKKNHPADPHVVNVFCYVSYISFALSAVTVLTWFFSLFKHRTSHLICLGRISSSWFQIILLIYQDHFSLFMNSLPLFVLSPLFFLSPRLQSSAVCTVIFSNPVATSSVKTVNIIKFKTKIIPRTTHWREMNH